MSEQKNTQVEREKALIEYMESLTESLLENPKAKIPNFYYLQLKNGQMFRVQVDYVELCRMPSAEEVKVAREQGDEWSSGEYPFIY